MDDNTDNIGCIWIDAFDKKPVFNERTDIRHDDKNYMRSMLCGLYPDTVVWENQRKKKIFPKRIGSADIGTVIAPDHDNIILRLNRKSMMQ